MTEVTKAVAMEVFDRSLNRETATTIAAYSHTDSLEWELLMQHLDGDRFGELLEGWKTRLGESTRRYLELVRAIKDKLSEVGLPVEDRPDGAPHIPLRGAQEVVDACVSTAGDSPEALKRLSGQLKVDAGGNGIWFGSTEILHAPGTAESYLKPFRKALGILERDAANTAFTIAYDRTVGASRTLEREGRILKAANFLPGRCEGSCHLQAPAQEGGRQSRLDNRTS